VGEGTDRVDADRSGTQRFLAFVRARDQAGIERLLQEFRPRCLAQAQRLLGGAADAEDAVQDAFLRLMRGAEAFDGSVPFAAWLGRLVQVASIDLQRSTGRRRRREHEAATPLATPIEESGDERVERLRRLVDELPEELRAPLELRFFDELSQRETAARLGLSENAVAVRIHRAKQELRRRLAQATGAVVAVPALDAMLREAGPGGAVAATASGVAAGKLAKWAALGLIAVLLISAWPAWRLLHPPQRMAQAPPAVEQRTASASDFPKPSVPVVPAGLAAPIAPEPGHRAYVWHFDDGPPSDLVVISGAWHWVRDGGIGGTGCMETDSNEIYIAIDRPRLEGALRATVQACPRLPAQKDYQVKVMWSNAEYQYQLENFGHPPFTVPMDAKHDNTVFYPVWAYIADDAIDQYSQVGRMHLDFMRRLPDAPLKFGIIGHHRIDDLVIEQVEPGEVPDVSDLRRAVYSVPLEKRRGTTGLTGVPGYDKRRPAQVNWGFAPLGVPPLVR
jgi:RNA polymerase sigma-70 factor (ECF subfamily)